MGSAEARRRYFAQLAKINAKTEDVRPVEIAGKAGFEFLGKRDRDGVKYRMRIVLLVDAGDILILMSSTQGKDPMSVPSIAAVWETIAFPWPLEAIGGWVVTCLAGLNSRMRDG